MIVGAWENPWAPEFKCEAAKFRYLPQSMVAAYLAKCQPPFEYGPENAKGIAFDFNGDGVEDQAYFLPWLGCGLCYDGWDAHFIISVNGTKARMRNSIQCYDVGPDDFVIVKGKPYFRCSNFFEHFEKSIHNHWVYQVYSFGKDGVMRFANQDFGGKFPAVTIYYINPKFKQIELTEADRKKIAKETMPKVERELK